MVRRIHPLVSICQYVRCLRINRLSIKNPVDLVSFGMAGKTMKSARKRFLEGIPEAPDIPSWGLIFLNKGIVARGKWSSIEITGEDYRGVSRQF